MPIEVELPDGTIAEFPDGTPNAVMEKALQSHSSAPVAPKAPAEAPGFFERLGYVAKGNIEGLQQAALGAGQMALQGGPGGIMARKIGQAFGADPMERADIGRTASEYAGNLAGDSRRAFDQTAAGQSPEGRGGVIMGQVAPALLSPAGGGNLLTRLGVAGLSGAGALGSTTPVEGGDFFSQKAAQYGTGALYGVGGQAVIGEPLRAVAGIGTALLSKGAKPNISPDAQRALDYAKQNNLPIYADDLMGGPVVRAAGQFSDDVPVIGSKGVRADQSKAAQAQAEAAAQRFAAPGSPTALRESAENQLQRAKGIKNKLYTDAFSELNKVGKFDLPATRARAEQLIKAEQAKGTLASQNVINELAKYVDAPPFNFEGWHGARSTLGQTISAARTGQDKILGNREAAALQQLKSVMDGEMRVTAQKAGGKGSQAWARADAFYAREMPKYKQGLVAAMLRSHEPDAVANRILGGTDSEGVALEVYRALDKPGRAQVRSALVNKALEKSMKSGDGGEAIFSPGEFAKQLSNTNERMGVFFNKSDQLELKGLQNYMQHIKKSGQYAANPPTGLRVLPHAVAFAASGAVNPGTLGIYAGLAVTARAATRTEMGRNLLLKLGQTSPGSKQAQAIIDQLNALGQRAAAQASQKGEGKQ